MLLAALRLGAKFQSEYLSFPDPNQTSNYFSRLKLVYFFLIQYVATEDQEGRPLTALHCVLRHARSLEGIQATGTPALTDQALQSVLDEANPLKDLRRFILTEAAGSRVLFICEQ